LEHELPYLCDIFELLNRINTGLQAKDEYISTSTDKIRAMKEKLNIWNRKAKEGNFEMFSRTSECMLKDRI
jgi:hypothetical protein